MAHAQHCPTYVSESSDQMVHQHPAGKIFFPPIMEIVKDPSPSRLSLADESLPTHLQMQCQGETNRRGQETDITLLGFHSWPPCGEEQEESA